jgi:hypothetical protein
MRLIGRLATVFSMALFLANCAAGGTGRIEPPDKRNS